jgi:hypothetical protein
MAAAALVVVMGGVTGILLRNRGGKEAVSIGGPVQANTQQDDRANHVGTPVPVAEPLVVEPARPAVATVGAKAGPSGKPHVPPGRLRNFAAVKTRTPARPEKSEKPEAAEPEAKADAKAGISPQAVEAKFKQVGNEYAGFKKNFGARLEDRWQQILQEAAMGRHDQHVDDLLNQLRKEMNKVKAGGE